MSTKQNSIWSEDEIRHGIDYKPDVAKLKRDNAWDRLLRDSNWRIQEPAEEIVAFNEKYLKNPENQIRQRLSGDYRRLHDLGSGGGRHTVYFAQQGYEVLATDLSESAIKFTRKALMDLGLDARVYFAPMTRLPFEDDFFDVTISRATVNHADLQGMKKSIFEVARTTRENGLFFLTTVSDRSSEWGKGRVIVPGRTFVPTEGPEKGLIHTYLTASESVALVEPFFRIEEIYLAEHPPLITKGTNLNSKSKNTYFGSEYVIIGVRR
jgi:SAM-dependent methyltransferase